MNFLNNTNNLPFQNEFQPLICGVILQNNRFLHLFVCFHGNPYGDWELEDVFVINKPIQAYIYG